MKKNRLKPSTQDRSFWQTGYENTMNYWYYYNRLVDLAISCFEWKNLPDTVDQRYLELGLLTDGMMLYFNDDVLGDLCLRTMIGADYDVYKIPKTRRAYADNGYNATRTIDDSVLIFNNYLHTSSLPAIAMFAQRLYNLDRTIDVNVNAQKTPVLIQADESERLTMKNLYKQYSGNEPFIFGTKNLAPDSLKVLSTGSPYVADKLYDLRTNIWNEALTYLGISNVSIEKKERLITDEVLRTNGGTVVSRYSRLEARRDACEKINEMFGTNLGVDFREDLNTNLPNEPVQEDPDDDDAVGGRIA